MRRCERHASYNPRPVPPSPAQLDARRRLVPPLTFPPELPVSARVDDLAKLIRDHRVVIVAGETGSGKSTQLPKICLKAGRGIAGLIGHTQPRRLAARTIAQRVAEEMKVNLGTQVGYKVRFTDETGPQTLIKLMTDGVLLAEAGSDPLFRKYDTIIVDEAHERSLNVDLVLGHLKRILAKRADLRVVITSATLDTQRFADFFADETGKPAPIAIVEGRTYPVEVRWRPPTKLADEATGKSLEEDPEQALVAAVDECFRHGPGDILIFQPTEREIRDCCDTLRRADPSSSVEILPLYARLSAAEQQRAFSPARPGARKIVVATNVAESSVTVPGVRFVIDTGTARMSRFASKGGGMQRLPIEPVSQASCNQRKGRCGRVGPGLCIRLFGEDDFAKRDPFGTPEVLRSDLAGVALQSEALGLGNLETFPFLDPPRYGAVKDAYQTLFELHAVEEAPDGSWRMTPLGRKLAKLPVDPRVGRMLLEAEKEKCVGEMLILASALESQDPRDRPLEKQAAADQAHAQFKMEGSDFLTLLRIWDFFHDLRGQGQSAVRNACRKNFVNYLRMREWQDLHRQLMEMAEGQGLHAPERAKWKHDADGKVEAHPKADAIHRSVLSGLLTGIAMKNEEGGYTAAGGLPMRLWPGSSCAKKKPLWVVAAERIETSDRFLRTSAQVDPRWIEPMAAHLVKRTHNEPHWVADTGSAMAYEKVLLLGLPIASRRRIPLAKVDAVAARQMFLRFALVEHDCPRMAEIAFMKHNAEAVREVQRREAKTGRRGLLKGEEERLEFFENRVPAACVDWPTFEKWRKEAEQTNPKILFFAESDVLVEDAGKWNAQLFPDRLAVGEHTYPLLYKVDGQDGVTLAVPREALARLDARRLGWLVPGLLEARIGALIKSLPKDLRRPLVPVPTFAKDAAQALRFGEGDLLEALAQVLTGLSGAPLSPADFDPAKVEDSLVMFVRVVDEKGKILAEDDNLSTLRKEFGVEAKAAFVGAGEKWNAPAQTQWTWGSLQDRVDLRRGPATVAAFPTLQDCGAEGAALRLLEDPLAAPRLHRAGVRRLCFHALGREARAAVKGLRNFDAMKLRHGPIGDAKTLQENLAMLAVDLACLGTDPLPRDEAAFGAALLVGKRNLFNTVETVGALATSILDQHHAVKLMQDKARDRGLAATDPLLQDLQSQLAHLMGAEGDGGFWLAAPWNWLAQYPRFLRAMTMRVDKAVSGGLQRDRDRAAPLLPPWVAYLLRTKKHREEGLVDPEREHWRWLFEEYRVAMFAQELGAGSVKVNAARLDEQWRKVKA